MAKLTDFMQQPKMYPFKKIINTIPILLIVSVGIYIKEHLVFGCILSFEGEKFPLFHHY
jgi:hypothetical protein